jgi:hypothetical protein
MRIIWRTYKKNLVYGLQSADAFEHLEKEVQGGIWSMKQIIIQK